MLMFVSNTLLYGNTAGGRLSAMKFLLILIIFALAFSGYSSASHAMGTQDCTSVSSTEAEECRHADAASDKDHASKHEKSKAGKCMDCTHCCASSPVIIQNSHYSFDLLHAVFVLEPSRTTRQDRLFSLLRPPRIQA